MATSEWISSAAHERRPAIGTGMEGNYQHVLAMARADERREAQDRVLAARTVQRIGGDEAAELLAMLGLSATPEPRRRVKPVIDHKPVTEKFCPRCGETKVAAEYVSRPRHADGLDTNCRVCNRKRKNEWARRRRAGQRTGVSQ